MVETINIENQLVAQNLTLGTTFLTLVEDLNFSLPKGKITAMVGESGSGKSLTALSIIGLLPNNAVKITSGSLTFSDFQGTINLATLARDAARSLRGSNISMIFQEPMTALNPSMRCGKQVEEVLVVHQPNLSHKERANRVLTLFDEVQLPNPKSVFNAYPHELSGGQKQRVLIAMALIANPKLLIADEPTTALDIKVQNSVLQLIKRLQQQYNLTVLFITHDLALVKKIADQVLVLYKGRLVEQGSVSDILDNPTHAYTKGLIACKPSLPRLFPLPTVAEFLNEKVPIIHQAEDPEKRQANHQNLYRLEPIMCVENISKYFTIKGGMFSPNQKKQVVSQVSFELYPGEALGLIGESGCGKSTLSRILMGLITPDSGTIRIENKPLSRKNAAWWNRQIQLIFQDPYGSLNPNQTIGNAIEEVLFVHKLRPHKAGRKERVLELLTKVGLKQTDANKYPHAFSGGQRQRIVIARALAAEPRILICDESVSALDVSVQAQILNLLLDLKKTEKLSFLFISHDLQIVRYFSDRIMVMYQGSLVEIAEADNLFQQPKAEYSKTLINAIY